MTITNAELAQFMANLLTTDESAVLAGLSRRGFELLVAQGLTPQPLKFGKRCRLFREAEIAAWATAYKRAQAERRTKKRSQMSRGPRD